MLSPLGGVLCNIWQSLLNLLVKKTIWKGIMTCPTTSSWLLRNSLRNVDDEKLAITRLFYIEAYTFYCHKMILTKIIYVPKKKSL